MADAYYAVATGPAYGAAHVDFLYEPDPPPRVSYALWTVLACIGIGIAGRQVFREVTSGGIEPEASIRYAFVATIGTYVLVAALLVRTLRTRLDWRVTTSSVTRGLLLGCTIAFVGLRGDISSADPRLALLVSDATPAHVAATVLIAVVAAPLCEEVLFRGLLARSLVPYGGRLAVWGSGFAFAVWHLEPRLVVYYTLFGTVFGGLYLRRGLACSIAAHAAFNGTLVVAAVMYALGPGVTLTQAGLVVTAPPGWHASPTSDIELRGPSAGQVFVEVLPGPPLHPADVLERIMEVEDSVEFSVRRDTARTLRLPVAEAMRVRIRSNGRDGDYVVFSVNGRNYAVSMLSGGSPRVRADFDKILRDMRVRR